jgi:hypothetical protein
MPGIPLTPTTETARQRLNLRRACERTAEQKEGLNKNGNLKWLADRQDLACPILSLASEQAKTHVYGWLRAHDKPGKAARLAFAADCNRKADCGSFFYITTELLDSVVSRWQKLQITLKSERAVQDNLNVVDQQILELQEDDHLELVVPDLLSFGAPSSGLLEQDAGRSHPPSRSALQPAMLAQPELVAQAPPPSARPPVLQPHVVSAASSLAQRQSSSSPARTTKGKQQYKYSKVDGRTEKQLADEGTRKDKKRRCKVCSRSYEQCKGATKVRPPASTRWKAWRHHSMHCERWQGHLAETRETRRLHHHHPPGIRPAISSLFLPPFLLLPFLSPQV